LTQLPLEAKINTSCGISSGANRGELIVSVSEALEFIDLESLFIISDVRQEMIVNHSDFLGHLGIVSLNNFLGSLIIKSPLISLLMALSSKVRVNSQDRAEMSYSFRCRIIVTNLNRSEGFCISDWLS
jgi:hypothetical protein